MCTPLLEGRKGQTASMIVGCARHLTPSKPTSVYADSTKHGSVGVFIMCGVLNWQDTTL